MPKAKMSSSRTAPAIASRRFGLVESGSSRSGRMLSAAMTHPPAPQRRPRPRHREERYEQRPDGDQRYRRRGDGEAAEGGRDKVDIVEREADEHDGGDDAQRGWIAPQPAEEQREDRADRPKQECQPGDHRPRPVRALDEPEDSLGQVAIPRSEERRVGKE